MISQIIQDNCACVFKDERLTQEKTIPTNITPCELLLRQII